MIILIIILLLFILAAILGGAKGVNNLVGLFCTVLAALILLFIFLVYLGKS